VTITKTEVENMFVRLAWIIGFFFIVLVLKDWMINTFGTATALMFAIMDIIIIAYKYKIKMPYYIRR